MKSFGLDLYICSRSFVSKREGVPNLLLIFCLFISCLRSRTYSSRTITVLAPRDVIPLIISFSLTSAFCRVSALGPTPSNPFHLQLPLHFPQCFFVPQLSVMARPPATVLRTTGHNKWKDVAPVGDSSGEVFLGIQGRTEPRVTDLRAFNGVGRLFANIVGVATA